VCDAVSVQVYSCNAKPSSQSGVQVNCPTQICPSPRKPTPCSNPKPILTNPAPAWPSC
jgi:hypothetical protein